MSNNPGEVQTESETAGKGLIQDTNAEDQETENKAIQINWTKPKTGIKNWDWKSECLRKAATTKRVINAEQ